MHAMAHWTAALSLMVILELAMDLCTHHGFLGRTGQDGLWQTCMVAQVSVTLHGIGLKQRITCDVTFTAIPQKVLELGTLN